VTVPASQPPALAARHRAAQLSLGEMLRRNAARTPHAPALHFEETPLTYGELNARVDRLANALRQREVRSGDRVGVWMFNSLEMVEALFAIQKLGAAAVPINFRLSDEEAAFIVDDAGVKGVIGHDRLLARSPVTAKLDWTLVVGDDAGSTYEDAVRAAEPVPPDAVVSDEAAAFVMYTSGTTGRPKGAVLTHKNLTTNTWNWMLEVGIQRGDVYSAGLPLFHIGGLVGLYPFVHLGSAVVLQPSGGFDPEAALDLQDRTATTVCAYVPAQWHLIVDCRQARDKLRGARRAIWGASPADRALLEAMVDTLPLNSVISTFGQTEVTANATFLGPADALSKLGSVGRAAPTMEYRIVDDEDNDIAAGEVGEIVYRGPTVMREYFERPDATEQAFRGGWFHSGDLVREDPEGYLYVVDRKDDMIISGAENIYPAEVERVLLEHPAVSETAVVGIAHEQWGQAPVAYVVAGAPGAATADELIAYCGERLARYKRPARVEFIDALPRNATGKVLKRELRVRAEKREA
jgi:acyl-CoA synthetase (AMP-forming)/AMP-acid ligase II